MLDAGQPVNSYAEADEAIMTRFGTNFDSSEIPVQYGNHGILKYGNQTLMDPDDCNMFIRFALLGGPGLSPEITRTFVSNLGIISISIFTKRNLGSRKAKEVADKIYPIFARVSFHGIKTEAPTLVEIGFEDSWYQVNMTIPYRWERCLTEI